jgi:hypothetical protein
MAQRMKDTLVGLMCSNDDRLVQTSAVERIFFEGKAGVEVREGKSSVSSV